MNATQVILYRFSMKEIKEANC